MSKRDALEKLGERFTLPTLPEVVVKINQMISDPMVGVREIGAAVSSDPGLTAKVLKIANSAFYGLSEPVLTAEDAASVIGVEALRNIALQASIMKNFEKFEKLDDFDLAELWNHAQLTAQLSQKLAQQVNLPEGIAADDFYTCGLLHDVGKVLLLDALRDEYLEVIRKARGGGRTLHACEEEAFHFNHVDVGALLARRWELPEAIVAAIQFHHGPREELLNNPAVAIVSLADQLAYRAGAGLLDAYGDRLGDLAQRILGVPPQRFAPVLELAREHYGSEQPQA